MCATEKENCAIQKHSIPPFWLAESTSLFSLERSLHSEEFTEAEDSEPTAETLEGTSYRSSA